MDSPRDFASRQYAHLMADGLDAAAARERLQDVLGAAATACLDADANAAPDAGDTAARLMAAARTRGGRAEDTHAVIIESLTAARLLALDWWRPARSFLLYVLVLLALAVVVSVIYAAFVLPGFGRLYQSMSLPAGAAGAATHAVWLVVPLLLIAVLALLLAWLWRRTRAAIARLQPLPARAGSGRWHGRAGRVYRALLCLEYAAALKSGSVADDAALEAALELAGWPAEQPLQTRGNAVADKLEQAGRLGTFGAELAWQRRLYWSLAQAALELWRDRLILAFRVIFYVLLGVMITLLYLPVFSLANTVGV